MERTRFFRLGICVVLLSLLVIGDTRRKDSERETKRKTKMGEGFFFGLTVTEGYEETL